ncbi:hypothetical protein E5475_22105 [Salmonella enterica]|nr:hypothetical protein [Salmonella enterica]EDI0160201.1 hypothetical protein [Salmonella enterica subsp. enterica serovar Panama]
MSDRKGMPECILFYNFHHANFMFIILIIKENLKFFHSEITTDSLVLLLRHSLAVGNSDQRVV